MSDHYQPRPGDVVAYGPLAALDGAISDVLTSAEMVKDGRYLQ